MDNMKVTSILGNTSGMPFGPDEIDETFGNMTLKDFVEQMPNVLGPVLGADFMAQMREQAAAMFAHPGKGFADHLNYTVSGALLELGDLAMPALYAALRDEDRNVRYQVASTLARVHGGDEQIVHLRTALTDPDPDVRGIVAAQLDQNGNPGSIDLLLLAYQDAESSVRERAIIGSHNWVIGWQDKRLIAALRQLSKHDPDSAVRSRAREMLQAIEPMQ
jgi:HEAT repeat protein